jgi:hypothetical protein
VAYPDECPRRAPVVVRQVVDEVAHYRSDDEGGDELEEAQGVEEDARVVRRCRLRAAVEGFGEHGGLLATSISWAETIVRLYALGAGG